ncbi:hypothetical protein TraAM80_05361, partial [Trypanosoma rangeli]
FEMRERMDAEVRGRHPAVEQLQVVHESELAALKRALQTAQEVSEGTCRELREQHEAYEARARRDMADMMERVEALRAELQASSDRREEERRRHEEEVCALRSRLHVQEEEAQQAAARLRSRHEQELTELRAAMDGLRAASVGRHETEQGLLSCALQRQICELQWAEACSKCRLQEAEGRHTLLCEALQGRWEVCSVIHRALVAVARELICPSECCDTTHFCQWVVEGTSRFAEAFTVSVYRLLDAKSHLFLACGVGLRGRARPGVTDGPSPHVPRGESHRLMADVAPPAASLLRRSVSTHDVTRSMVRYSKMLNEQHLKNDTRLQRLGALVTRVDDLIERGRAVSRLERSHSEEP